MIKEAFTTCENCHQQIPEEDVLCPHCGFHVVPQPHFERLQKPRPELKELSSREPLPEVEIDRGGVPWPLIVIMVGALLLAVSSC